MDHLSYRVSSLADLPRASKSFRPTHVVSLLDPHATLPRTRVGAGNHLGLLMHDLDGVDDGTMPGNPHRHHMDTLLSFAAGLTQSDRVLFHCMAGKRRSTAAAWICDLAFRISHGAPKDARTVASSYAHLRGLRPVADPNRALLQLADAPLSLGGSLANFAFPPRVLDLTDDDYSDPVI
tara:strand:+ start:226 stop:762 length:537 start_codon:yes stop_codon:yes gene_type:complete